MRTAFFGKGGTGKTTFAAAYTEYLQQKGEKVLAIDADHNQHLGETLNIPVDKKIGNYEKEIKQYVKGDRNETIISSTPPSAKSNFIRLGENNKLLRKFTTKKDNISLLTVGSYEKEDKGATCYHGKQDSLALLLNHLLDTKEDNIVIDGTAGVDSYGSSLATAFDVSILLIEPTKKSISVYKEFKDLTESIHTETFIVVNKVELEEDKEFIQQHIPEEEILGYVERSTNLRKFEQGHSESFKAFVKENKEVFKRINKETRKRGKDWEAYLDNLKEVHKGVSESWYDEYYNEPLSKQANTDFTYQDAIHKDTTRKA